MTEAIGGLAVKVDFDTSAVVKQWQRAIDAMKQRAQAASFGSALTGKDSDLDTFAKTIGEPAREAAKAAEDANKEAADRTKEAWKSALGGMRTAFLGAATAAAGAVAALTANVFESATAIDRQARSLGVSTDEIQRMRYAAEQAGLEGNELGEAMGGLVQRVQSAAEGGGDAARRFRELGIDLDGVRDGTVSANELFLSSADALAQMGPGTEQTATAIQLFGEKGRLLLPVLAQGRAGLNRLGAEFDELGGGLDEETIASVQATNREFARLKLAFTAEVLPAVRGLIGGIQRITERARPMLRTIREWFTDSHNIRTVTIALTGAVIALGVASANAAAATIIAWAPVIGTIAAVAAGIAVVALGVDDLITAFEGGDSVIGRFVDSLLGVGTTRGAFNELRSSMIGAQILAEEIEGTFHGMVASINDAFVTLGNTILNTVNTALEGAALAADAAGIDTNGTALSADALVQRRVQQQRTFLQGSQTSIEQRTSQGENARRAGALEAGRVGYATGNLALLTAPATQAVRDATSGPTSRTASVNSRVQVQIQGVIPDTAFDQRVQNAVRSGMEQANADAAAALVETADE